jgi:hypothetical protein
LFSEAKKIDGRAIDLDAVVLDLGKNPPIGERHLYASADLAI